MTTGDQAKLFLPGVVACVFFLFLAVAVSSAEAKDGRFESLRAHMALWLDGVGDDVPIKSAHYVKSWVIDQWDMQQEDYLVVSVRPAAAYAYDGHVPNAINIPWHAIVDIDSLERLDPLKTHIVYGDQGDAGVCATVLLNLMDYSAYALKFGMMNWNALATTGTSWDGQADYPVERGRADHSETHTYPSLPSDSSDTGELLRERFRKQIVGRQVSISAEAVKQVVDSWPSHENTHQIVSIRNPVHFAQGHVPHAINIPWQELLDPAQLSKLDPQKKVIVYCYTGHLARIGVTLLRLLGYDAVNMRFGMMDWNKEHVGAPLVWQGAQGYPVVSAF